VAELEPREQLIANLDKQRRGCESGGSPFYAGLLVHMQDDVRASGPTWQLLAPYASQPFEPVYPLRLLGALHRRVLRGDDPVLARHFPSVGGDGDADAAWPLVRVVLDARASELATCFDHAVQTNEVARSVALVGGLLTIAARTGLPASLHEVGASAGLNLRAESYWYEQHGRGWGDPASPVRFVDRFADGSPPFDAPLVISTRRGCDRDPIDANTEDGRLTLLSYVWPGMHSRFEMLRAALDVAPTVPVELERADAAAWVERELQQTRTGVVTVVWHSIVWQYLDDASRARIVAALEDAGSRTTIDAPLAWLRLEPWGEGLADPRLLLRLWPGGDDELLARAGFHQQPVTWVASAR
jgi:hypothetical protein